MNRRSFLARTLAAGAVAPALSTMAAAQGQRNAAAQKPIPDVAKSVQLCVFDTFGTVVDWHASVSAEVAKLAKEKGWNIDAVEFAEAWRANYGPSRNQVRTGKLPWTKLDQLHRMTLDGLLTKYKLENLTEEEKVHLNKVWHRLHGWPDSSAGLGRLKKRYVLSPLSNGNVALLTDMAKFANLPWDCILGSDIARHYKPDKEMYMMPGEFFDVPPSAVMMVAAHPDDLDSAKSYGLRTAYVHRPLENGTKRPHGPMPAAGRFDFLANDFNDLASQLGL